MQTMERHLGEVRAGHPEAACRTNVGGSGTETVELTGLWNKTTCPSCLVESVKRGGREGDRNEHPKHSRPRR